MRIFKHTYRDGDGKKHKTKNYYVAFSDRDGKEWRVAAFTDRRATAGFAYKLERLLACHASGEAPDRELVLWLEGIPAATRARLAKIGVLDSRRAAAGKPLTEHLADFEAGLSATGRSEMYVKMTATRIRAVLNGCHFEKWSDITAGQLEAFLAAQRKPRSERDSGLSIQTSNYYTQAFKQFCRWMVSERRASESPVAHVKRMNAQTDRRVERRALSADECRRLLSAAEASAETVYGMTGPDRAILYRLALETGLRWGELRSLTRGSFNLDGDRPTVSVEAGYSKHRREDTLPLRRDTAIALKAFMGPSLPATRAFTMPKRKGAGATMVRHDLAATGSDYVSPIPYEDAQGRRADFHSLRHSFITNLCNGGVHPKAAQSLARHSTITLTLDRYTHLALADQRGALNALPDLSTPAASQAVRATGTDGAVTLPDSLPEKVREGAYSSQELTSTTRVGDDGADSREALQTLGKPGVSGKMLSPREGGEIGRRAGPDVRLQPGRVYPSASLCTGLSASQGVHATLWAEHL